MVEQNAAIQQQRQTEAEHGLTAMQALWGQCLQQLVERGLDRGSDRRGAAADARRAGADRPSHRGQAHHRPRASPQPLSPAGEAREPDVDAVRAARHPRRDQDAAVAAVADRRDLPAQARCGRRAAQHHALPLHGVSGGPAGARSASAPDLGRIWASMPALLRRAGEPAALQRQHLGRRRSRRPSARHRGGDPRRRSTTCGCTACCCCSVSWPRWRGSAACPIACSRRPPRCVDRVRQMAARSRAARAAGDRPASRRKPGGSWSA